MSPIAGVLGRGRAALLGGPRPSPVLYMDMEGPAGALRALHNGGLAPTLSRASVGYTNLGAQVLAGVPRYELGRWWRLLLYDPAPGAPTLAYGGELLTDPGLEAAYVAGLCSTLTKTGLPTLNQSADVHGGAKAQQFTATAQYDSLRWANVNIDPGEWYMFALWAKRTAGATGQVRVRMLSSAAAINLNIPITSAGYSQYSLVARNASDLTISARIEEFAAGPFDTVIMDDGSFKQITTSSLLSGGGPCPIQAGLFRANATIPANLHGGIAHTNDAATGGWAAYYDRALSSVVLAILGVGPAALTVPAVYAAGTPVQVIRLGNEFYLYYNGVLRGQITVAGLPTLTQFTAFSTDPTVVITDLTAYYVNNALTVEEGTTNLLSANQSSVETNIVGFAVLGSGIAQSNTFAWSGGFSLRTITGNVGAGEGFDTTSVVAVAAQNHTASVWLRGAGTVVLALQERDAVDALIGETVSGVITLTQYWARYQVSRLFGALGVNARLVVRTNVAQGITFYADGLQIEQRAYATSWQIGGTARVAEATISPKVDGYDWRASTVSAWFRLDTLPSVMARNARICDFYADVTNRMALYVRLADNRLTIYNNITAATVPVPGAAGLIAVNTWYHVAVVQDGYTARVYVDGALALTTTFTAMPNATPSMYLGSWYLGTQQLNGLIDDFRVYDKVLSADAVGDIYRLGPNTS